MTNQLTFHDKPLTPVTQDNQLWLTSKDLAKALGYKAADSVTKIFNRKQDEFTPCMSLTVKLTVNGINSSSREKETRIFSLRGCHLIAMFSRTAVAKEFRKWVLDILDKESVQAVPQTIDSIITELSDQPGDIRYLLHVKRGEAKVTPIDISNKSLVNAQAARNLKRDMSLMIRRMNEMTYRMSILSGDCDASRLINPIE